METLLQDLRYAIRTLLRSRGFTLVAVLTLALGIGANTAIFSVVNAVLLRPLPYDAPDRIVLLSERSRAEPGQQGSTSYLNFADWQAQSTSFEAMALFNGWQPALTGVGEPEMLQGALVTAGIFDVFRIRPVLGRPMLPSDNQPGSESVVVLSHGFWQSRLSGDPQVVGRTITLNGIPRTVIAVLPPDFTPPGELAGEVWGNNYPDPNDTRASRYLRAIGRIGAGARIDQVRTEMATISARLEAEHPMENAGMEASLIPLREALVGSAERPLLILLGAALLVLLIACANLSSLLLSRGIARTRELAVRAALGASRGREVRQLLTESLLLAALGTAAGLLLGVRTLQGLLAWAPETIRSQEISLDGRVLLFAVALTLLSSLLFGLFPALRSTRLDLQSALKEGTRGATSGTGMRSRGTLVVAQLGVALTLLVGAGLLLRSFARLQQVDPGIHPEGVLTLSLNLPAARYPGGTEPAFFAQLLERLHAIPGVRGAGVVSTLPFGGGWDRVGLDVEGEPALSRSDRPEVDRYIVSPEYFATMGIPLKAGRLLHAQDRFDAPLVAVVDEAFAHRLSREGSPVGMRVQLPGRDALATIVGVVGHVKHYGLDASSSGQVYVSHQQYPWRWMTLVVKTAGEPHALVSSVRAAVRSLDPDQPVFGITSMEQLMAERTATRRFALTLLGAFAGMALILAAVGLSGVIASNVVQRWREMGIRMALGAAPREVLRMVVRQGMAITLMGIGLGLVAAFVLTRWLGSLLYGVSARDPLTFVLVAAVFATVAFVAAYLPARRATRVDPMIALRTE